VLLGRNDGATARGCAGQLRRDRGHGRQSRSWDELSSWAEPEGSG
jgi:hypothetical protein